MITGVIIGSAPLTGTVLSAGVRRNIATITTSAPHRIKTGEQVILADVSKVLDGTHTVVSVPSKTSFTFSKTTRDIPVAKVKSGSYTVRKDYPNADISDIILSMEVSLTVDMASQVTIRVTDPGLEYMRANYFQIRQPITCFGQDFEIAAVEVSQGEAGEEVTLECRLASVQKLKRDKGRAVFRGGSATSFAADRARLVGLRFFGENSTAKSSISRVRNDKTDESTWDVLQRLAGDNQFWLFESDGQLFFCSQQFLLGKFAVVLDKSNPGFLATVVSWSTELPANDPPRLVKKFPPIPVVTGADGKHTTLKKGNKGNEVKYLQTVLSKRAGQALTVDGIFGNTTRNAVLAVQRFVGLSASGVVGPQTWAIIDFLASGMVSRGGGDGLYRLVPIEVPNVRRSEDTYEEMTATFRVEREIGKKLRPGMTVRIEGIPGFTANLLISEVTWEEGTETPVSVSARTVQMPEDAKELAKAEAKIDLTGGGFANIDYAQTLN